MRSIFSKKSALALVLTSGLTSFVYAQTIRPDALEPIEIKENAAYVQNFDGVRDGKYPSGWGAWNVGAIQQGHQQNNNPRVREAPEKENMLKLFMSGSAATTVASVYTFNKRLGFKNGRSSDVGIYASFNTSSVPASKKIKVTFDALVMRNLYGAAGGNLINALALQYRIGSTGDFKTIDEAIQNNATIRETGGIPAVQKTVSFILPDECAGKPVIQLRWITKHISGAIPEDTASLPSFAIDNFVAEVQK
ncbi:hypothetical protein [Pseudopedobacter beijingensis]|uniref:Uncharacterized protein n=1 Tax=Pseudopedobacter beijingensis TaxID=1207056 RepID=A0ABW4IGC6_9SPHI